MYCEAVRSEALLTFLVLLGEKSDGAIVERRAGAQDIGLAGEQLLALLKPELLLMQPFLDQEDFRHLRALSDTALVPYVRVCHFVFQNSQVSIV